MTIKAPPDQSAASTALRRCMRAHRVPNFPDPGSNGGMSVNLSPGGSTITIDGIAFSGPTFQAAEKICTPLGSSGAKPAVPDQQKLALLADARCMRQHGVPRFTDPQFPLSGGIFGGGVDCQDASSPEYKGRPAAVCNKTLGGYGPG
jgi:hypothetical protein